MTAKAKSRNSLDGEIITIRKGLAIYKVHSSPYWMCRLRDSKNKRNIVRSTKETSRIEARRAAEEFAASFFQQSSNQEVSKSFKFAHFADLVEKDAIAEVTSGSRAETHVRDLKQVLYNKDRGLIPAFGHRDIREITTRDFTNFVRKIQEKHPNLSSSTHNQIRIVFRRVLRTALMEGTITSVPEAPKINQTKKTTRTYFRFHPLVFKEKDEYKKLLKVADELARERTIVRGTPVTEELRDIVIFATHSFLRPAYSELYAIKHSDITVRDNPQRLQITVRHGKTGRRMIDTMPACVSVYERICERYPEHLKADDYIFLPAYSNRKTAMRVIMRQFNYLLNKAGLKIDAETGKPHSMYSLRHTSLMMRAVLGEGDVDMFYLAKNSGTSIEMLQKFYVSQLPMTNEMARNIQSFGKNRNKKK